MQYAAELIADDLQDHDPAYALESAARAARTGSEKHADTEYHPCDVRPLSGIGIEHSRCSDE